MVDHARDARVVRGGATPAPDPGPRARAWVWLRLVGTAALVGLAANYLVHSFPLEEVVIVYDRY
jgi:hypothetical protein